MTTIEEGIYSYLTGRPRISDLLDDRIYPKRLPQNPTYPAMVYRRIDTRRPIAHDGPGGLAQPRFQFDCYGSSTTAARALANTLREEINGFQGLMNGVLVSSVIFLDEVDDFGPEVAVDRVTQDYRFTHKE